MIYLTPEFKARHELLMSNTDHYIFISTYRVYADKDKIKFTKNNFMQSTKQLISLGITIDELQTFLTSKISESTPVI